MKKSLVAVGMLLAIVVLCRGRGSRHHEVVARVPAQQRSVPAPPAPAVAPATIENSNARAPALAAVESRRRASGHANAEPLPPPMDAYKEIRKTPARTINGQPFQLLATKAVPRDQYRSQMGKLLFEQNDFAFFAAPAGFERANYQPDGLPVLVSSNGRPAIATGSYVIVLRDPAAAAEIGAAENFTLLSLDEQTRTAFFKAPPGYPLLAGQERLEKDARIERVELDLYQSRKGRTTIVYPAKR